MWRFFQRRSSMSLHHILCFTSCMVLSASVCRAGHLQSIEGRVLWPENVSRASHIKLVMNLEHGGIIYAWPKADGTFTFHGVPEGIHLLDVYAMGLIYPQVHLEVNGKYPGGALASFAEHRTKTIPPPLVLQPKGLAEYFEKREPFNVISFLKTPYGLMAAFGIFAIVVLPRLKMDPDELREARESLTGRSTETPTGQHRS